MGEFKMPSLGADMESAILMEWKVKEGDRVKKGDIIAEIEASKGVIEIEVFEDGIVEKLLVEPETECAVGTTMALIKGENEATSESAPSAKEPAKEEKTPSDKHPRISPAAKKRAKELGLDIDALALKGEVHLEQIEAAAKTAGKPAETDGMRQAIAAAMSRSNAEIPHYYLSTSINMTPALMWLEELNRTRSIKERILPAALLIHAVVKALKEVPELNGFWKEGVQQISEEINPGIAIALRKGGLITPALLDAGRMSLDETMRNLDELIMRTRSGKLRGAELSRQTVTITNLGDLGVERVYGVIYPPQVAIVGLGKIIDSPWVVGDALAVRKVMQATIAGDHRATDGRTGALFLDRLNKILQKPEELK